MVASLILRYLGSAYWTKGNVACLLSPLVHLLFQVALAGNPVAVPLFFTTEAYFRCALRARDFTIFNALPMHFSFATQLWTVS